MKKFAPILLLALALSNSFAANYQPINGGYAESDISMIDPNNPTTPFSITGIGGLSFATGVVRTISFGTTGVKLGASGDKLAFYGATPVAKPTGDIATALVDLGLVTSPTLSGGLISGGSGTLDLSGYSITLPSDVLLQVRHGTFAELQTITLAIAEVGYTTDTKELWVGDGSTTGGTKIGLNRQAGTSFSPPASASVPDIVLFSNTTTNGSEMQVQFASGKWMPFWRVKPSTASGITNATTPGSFVIMTLGVQGAATSSGSGGSPGLMTTSGFGTLMNVSSGSGGASASIFNGGDGGHVSRGTAHQSNFIGGNGGAAGSGASGGNGGDGGLGIQAQGGVGGVGGTASGANGGSGGYARPTSSINTPSITANGGAGGAGGTVTGAGGGQGGFSLRINGNGGNGGAGGASSVGGGLGGDGFQLIGNGGAGATGSFNGGNAGVITISGGAATTSVAGGRGGNLTLTGAAGHNGGDIDLSATTTYDGPSIVSTTADPETVLTYPPGSIARDVANGVAYFKISGTSNTGWVRAGLRVRTVPANSAAAGAVGQWFSDDSWFYFYGATGWRRIAAVTF